MSLRLDPFCFLPFHFFIQWVNGSSGVVNVNGDWWVRDHPIIWIVICNFCVWLYGSLLVSKLKNVAFICLLWIFQCLFFLGRCQSLYLAFLEQIFSSVLHSWPYKLSHLRFNLLFQVNNRRSRRWLNDRLLMELVPRLNAEEIRGLFAPPPWGKISKWPALPYFMLHPLVLIHASRSILPPCFKFHFASSWSCHPNYPQLLKQVRSFIL